jgi:Polyketide cyclase / dehydrase and lipid transport
MGLSDLRHYRFSSVWFVDARPEDAFDVLSDLGDYPKWWPEVREIWRIDDDTVEARARSLLPYDLRFTMRRGRQDRDAGVLQTDMTGELEGYSRFTISPAGHGSRLLFEEEVVTNKASLNRLAPIARPAFKWNHSLMMRHGLAGLRTYLAGYRRARDSA